MKIGDRVYAIMKRIIKPWIRIHIDNVIGIDGKVRKCYLWIGVLWEWHWLGYWQEWYDGPIHHFSFGPMSIYWMTGIE